MISTPHIDVLPAEQVRNDIRVRVQAASGPFVPEPGIVARSIPAAHAIEFRHHGSIAHLLKAPETIAKVGGNLTALGRIVEAQDGQRLAALVAKAEQGKRRQVHIEADPEPEEE